MYAFTSLYCVLVSDLNGFSFITNACIGLLLLKDVQISLMMMRYRNCWVAFCLFSFRTTQCVGLFTKMGSEEALNFTDRDFIFIDKHVLIGTKHTLKHLCFCETLPDCLIYASVNNICYSTVHCRRYLNLLFMMLYTF